MKGFDFKDLFCEILSGLSFVFLLIPLLDLFSVISICSFFKLISSNISLSNVLSAAIASYLLGIIVDCIGLAIGDRLLDDIVCSDAPNENHTKLFWRNVETHVLAYRDRQWAFYACYRDIFLLFIPAGVLWTICIIKYFSLIYAGMTIIIFLLLEIGLFFGMKVLLQHYYSITKSCAE